MHDMHDFDDETDYEIVDLSTLEVGDKILTSSNKEYIVYKIMNHKIQSIPIYGLSLDLTFRGNIQWFHEDGMPQMYWAKSDLEKYPYISKVIKSPVHKDLVVDNELEYCKKEIHTLLRTYGIDLSLGLDSSLILTKFSDKIGRTVDKSLTIIND